MATERNKPDIYSDREMGRAMLYGAVLRPDKVRLTMEEWGRHAIIEWQNNPFLPNYGKPAGCKCGDSACYRLDRPPRN